MSLTNPNSNIIVVSGFDFTAALNEKADVVHQHQIVNVENLQTTLDEKASVDHEHQIEQIVGLSTALYNKASTEALNLKYNDLVDLIFSVSVYSKETPDVQFYGQIWHELNASNDILESWVFADIPTLGSRWISTTTYEKNYFAGSSSINGGVAYAIPLKQNVNYLFLDFQSYILYSAATPIDTTANYWRVLWGMQSAGINVANSGALAYDNTSKEYPLNLFYAPSPGERLLCMFNKTGSPPGARLASSIRYKLVRR